ncbi:MAG: sulfotransferase family protein [Isosphaeraceae bacterium]
MPDFIIIGAMKSATTTLHEQLARQPGFRMSRPKEPNFFSDDRNFARGLDWYASCFAGAGDQQIVGETSTHYTKLPTYPRTVLRMVRVLPRVKLIYVMRHPIDRLRSHYLHDVTVGRIKVGLEEAVDRYPDLVDYGRYSMQLAPYLLAYGPEHILSVFHDRLVRHPDLELERISVFLGAPAPLRWDRALQAQNVGRQRLRHSLLREFLVQLPVLAPLRHRLIPRSVVERLKEFWRIDMDPPRVSSDLAARLRAVFDPDLARLGNWLGIRLDTDSFHDRAREQPARWVQLEQTRTT